MPAHVLRLLDQVPLLPGDQTLVPRPQDLSDDLQLELVIIVSTAGVAPAADDGTPGAATLTIQHAPCASPLTWLDLPTAVAVDLTVAGTTWVHVPYFTAFLNISLTGRLSEAAVVTVEIVGKR